MNNLTCYRLCVLASGSLITDIFSCFTLIIVSCLHLGQNSGKFSSTVSPRILTRVLLPQIGHNIHSYLDTLLSLYLMFWLTTIILLPLHFKNLIEPIESEFARRTNHLENEFQARAANFGDDHSGSSGEHRRK